jgi:integrin alpha FG-GAP repeat containing protein 1
MGVGRSNNFLESFNSGYSINNNLDSVKVFSPIIPNSQLYILAGTTDSDDWILELFINPDRTLIIISLIAGLTLFLLGLGIVWMHIKEKQEDIKDRP